MNISRVPPVGLALAAIVLWGLFPIFWKQLAHIDPLEVLAHRIIWAVPFLAVILFLTISSKEIVSACKPWNKLIPLAASAVMITLNWGLYIWAMGENKIVEASMGYFLAPLINVSFGVLFFKEKLHITQWFAILIAACAVIGLFLAREIAPWLALYLAGSFAAYSAIRKKASQDAVVGLFFETAVLTPFAIGLVIYKINIGTSVVYLTNLPTTIMLAAAGVITVLPLWLWVSGCRKINLSTAGLLFYLTPTIQFFVGIFIYNEPLPLTDLIAFSGIWLALTVLAMNSYKSQTT